jgi:hypothetical protein
MEIVGVALQSGRLHEEADKEDEAFRDQAPWSDGLDDRAGADSNGYVTAHTRGMDDG